MGDFVSRRWLILTTSNCLAFSGDRSGSPVSPWFSYRPARVAFRLSEYAMRAEGECFGFDDGQDLWADAKGVVGRAALSRTPRWDKDSESRSASLANQPRLARGRCVACASTIRYCRRWATIHTPFQGFGSMSVERVLASLGVMQ